MRWARGLADENLEPVSHAPRVYQTMRLKTVACRPLPVLLLGNSTLGRGPEVQPASNAMLRLLSIQIGKGQCLRCG